MLNCNFCRNRTDAGENLLELEYEYFLNVVFILGLGGMPHGSTKGKRKEKHATKVPNSIQSSTGVLPDFDRLVDEGSEQLC